MEPADSKVYPPNDSLTGAGGFNFLVFIPAKVIQLWPDVFQLGCWKKQQMDYVFMVDFFPVMSKENKSIDT